MPSETARLAQIHEGKNAITKADDCSSQTDEEVALKAHNSNGKT
jgi:hypothetical protein